MSSKDLKKLKREIHEVKLLLDGLSAYNEIPDPIIELAISKTNYLRQLLLELKNGHTIEVENIGVEKIDEPILEIDEPLSSPEPELEEKVREETIKEDKNTVEIHLTLEADDIPEPVLEVDAEKLMRS